MKISDSLEPTKLEPKAIKLIDSEEVKELIDQLKSVEIKPLDYKEF